MTARRQPPSGTAAAECGSSRTVLRSVRRALGIAVCVMLTVSGCAFSGLNSLPLPGAIGRGPDASTYHVEIANVGTLEANSPVMVNDVIVGSVSKLTVSNWHANVEVSVQPGVVIPANVVASVGQTSLLGSMHLALNTPLDQPAKGKLQPGATIPLNRSSTYPSTEQTLSSLSVVLNAGGLGQIGDIINNFNTALSGHPREIRDLLQRLDKFVGTFDAQRENLVASIQSLNRLTGTLAGQRDVITQALNKIPPALDVLIRERPRLTTALNKLGTFGDTATRLVNDAGSDLVNNLRNLEPTLRSLADVGPELDQAIAYAPTFPFNQGFIDRYVRGDYVNGYFIIDLTNSGLRKSILRGTHWERLGAEPVPAPGDPQYLQFRYGAPPGSPGSFLPGPPPAAPGPSPAGAAGPAPAAAPGPAPAAAPGLPGPAPAEQGAPAPAGLPPWVTPVEGSG